MVRCSPDFLFGVAYHDEVWTFEKNQENAAQMGNLLEDDAGKHYVCFVTVLFLLPAKFPDSGVAGIAVLLKYLWDIPPASVIFALNLVLFIYGWKVLSKGSSSGHSGPLRSFPLPCRFWNQFPRLMSPTDSPWLLPQRL